MDSLKARAADIQLLVLDVDGVLTDGRLYFTARGEEMKCHVPAMIAAVATEASIRPNALRMLLFPRTRNWWQRRTA